jgi:hypothetical protein
MTLLKKLKRLKFGFRRGRGEAPAEKVLLTVTREDEPERVSMVATRESIVTELVADLPYEIDFTRTEDLESYMEDLKMPAAKIENWISAGVLYPEEIKIAEKMLRILRKKG